MKNESKEEQSELKFKTYLNYLRNFSEFTKSHHTSIYKFLDNIWRNTKTIQGAKQYDKNVLHHLLKIAWNTEFLACTNLVKETQIVRINNHWKSIQVYYAIYSCGQALVNLLSKDSKSSHAQCLKSLSSFFN